MALQGPDGETHSHLSSEDRRDSHSKHAAQQPDRGMWVGPRPGQTHEQHAEGVRRANAAKEWGDRIEREDRERLEKFLASPPRMPDLFREEFEAIAKEWGDRIDRENRERHEKIPASPSRMPDSFREEFEAVQAVYDVLKLLDDRAKKRVMVFVNSKFADDEGSPLNVLGLSPMDAL